ncbi:hypothetical protein D3C71_1677540 [compost metagenome]
MLLKRGIAFIKDPAAQVAEHGRQLLHPQFHADDNAGHGAEMQHHRLAAAARFSGTDLQHKLLLAQLGHEIRDGRLIQAGHFRHSGARERRFFANGMEDEGFIDFLDQRLIAGDSHSLHFLFHK